MHPLFSILIPTKDRPALVRDAVASALMQDGSDFEVVVSNNGGDAATRAALAAWRGDHRFRYVEPPAEMNMPDHWEWASACLHGEYVLVLTDRTLLRSDAVAVLRQLVSSLQRPEAISWGVASYSETTRIASGLERGSEAIVRVDTAELQQGLLDGTTIFGPVLPKGLNSCVRRDIYAKIRAVRGRVFDYMCPDYSSAYSVVYVSTAIHHRSRPLAVARATHLSNGHRHRQGIDTGYARSIGSQWGFRHIPLDVPLETSILYEDFFRTAAAHGRPVQWHDIDLIYFYRHCFRDIVRLHAHLPPWHVALRKMRSAFFAAVANEGSERSASIRKALLGEFSSQDVLSGAVNCCVSSRLLDALRRVRHRLQKKPFYESAIQAAGFERKHAG